jgi:hypothetical protein
VSDIAVLGIAVDSRPVTAATTELNKLTAAAKPAQAGISGLEKAAVAAGAAMPGIEKGAKAAAAATDKLGAASELAGRRHGAAAGSLSQLSFQINDIASGLAMGQSPFQIMAQQGGQVFQVWQMNNNIFKEAGRFIGSLITPMRLLGIGVAAAGVAAYAMNAAWNSTEMQFDDTSRAIGETIQKLHALESAASFKGIETDDFLKAAEKFGAATYAAKNNMGGLADVFRANGVHVGTFSENMERAADLIKNAKNDQQRLSLLQQMGLPATMQWVRFLSQGGDALRRAADEATQVGGQLDEQLIAKARAFDEAWARAWKNVKNSAQQSFIELKAWLSGFSLDVTGWINSQFPGSALDRAKNALRIGMSGGHTGANPRSNFTQGEAQGYYDAVGYGRGNIGVGGAAGGDTIDHAALRQTLALEQPRIGLLGQTASVRKVSIYETDSAITPHVDLRSTLPKTKNKGADRDSDQRRRAA